MKRILLAVFGLALLPGAVNAQNEIYQIYDETTRQTEEATECVETTVTDRLTGEVSYYDSCAAMECPEGMCGSVTETPSSEGTVVYRDGQAHEVVKVLTTRLKQGTATGDYRLVVTRRIGGFGEDEGLPNVPIGPGPITDDPVGFGCAAAQGIAITAQ